METESRWVVTKPGEEAMRLPDNWYGTAFLGEAHTLELVPIIARLCEYQQKPWNCILYNCKFHDI